MAEGASTASTQSEFFKLLYFWPSGQQIPLLRAGGVGSIPAIPDARFGSLLSAFYPLMK